MENENILEPTDELYHHGIKGMHWGIRRYQTKDGSLTPAGKKRYDKDMAKVKAETQKIKNQQRTAAKLAKLEAAKKNLQDLKDGKSKGDDKNVETDSQKRDRILKQPNAKEVLENRHLFSDKEIQSIRIRLQEENTIKSLVPAEVDKGQQFVDKTVSRLDRISSVVDSGSKAWNSMAKVYNSLLGKRNGIELPMINEKTKSKADKIKEEAELLEAKNRLKKAQEEGKEKEKSDLDRMKEETAWIDAQNKNREAKRASKKHDESDAKEAAKAAEKARKENDARSQQEYDSTAQGYRKTTGERTVVDPNVNRGLSVTNRTATSSGKSYVDRSSNTNAISANVASRIRSLTAGGDKTYSEIANALGVSTSTVQNYSRGRDAAFELLDRNGGSIIEFD